MPFIGEQFSVWSTEIEFFVEQIAQKTCSTKPQIIPFSNLLDHQDWTKLEGHSKVCSKKQLLVEIEGIHCRCC